MRRTATALWTAYVQRDAKVAAVTFAAVSPALAHASIEATRSGDRDGRRRRWQRRHSVATSEA